MLKDTALHWLVPSRHLEFNLKQQIKNLHLAEGGGGISLTTLPAVVY